MRKVLICKFSQAIYLKLNFNKSIDILDLKLLLCNSDRKTKLQQNLSIFLNPTYCFGAWFYPPPPPG